MFPGSYYRFRVRTVCKSGISEPSKATDRIFIGRPQEDEVFGLPGGNYPKEQQAQKRGAVSKNLHQFGNNIRNSKRFSSLGQDLPEVRNLAAPLLTGPTLNRHHEQQPRNDESKASLPPSAAVPKGRQFSLERDVYYFNNRREEVVTYDAGSKKLGTLAAKQGLTNQEQDVYKRSLGDLCAKLLTASRSQLPTVTPEYDYYFISCVPDDKVFYIHKVKELIKF